MKFCSNSKRKMVIPGVQGLSDLFQLLMEIRYSVVKMKANVHIVRV